MNREIRLISILRHIKRREQGLLTLALMVSSLALCGWLATDYRSKPIRSSVFAGSLLASLVTGATCLSKLNKKQNKAQKLLQRHRERKSLSRA